MFIVISKYFLPTCLFVYLLNMMKYEHAIQCVVYRYAMKHVKDCKGSMPSLCISCGRWQWYMYLFFGEYRRLGSQR